MKKAVIIIGVAGAGIAILLFIILIPVLMILSFFSSSGADVTDAYVENNSKYSKVYKEALNNNIRNGYVPLTRILYFYNENSNLSFDEIYKDNLDKINKKMLPISEVCKIKKYNKYYVCEEEAIKNSNQVDVEQNKPFNFPTDLSKITITSFFMEQRNVGSSVHGGWDLAGANHTSVYSPCEGKVTNVNFPFSSNIPNYDVATGNSITISCNVNNITYEVVYMHLYPSSALVKKGQEVSHYKKIASIGNTGYSTGSHLHYEVRINNKKVDGMSLIDFNMKK